METWIKRGALLGLLLTAAAASATAQTSSLQVNPQDAAFSRSIWRWQGTNEWHYSVRASLVGPLTGLDGKVIIPEGQTRWAYAWGTDEDAVKLPLLALLTNDRGQGATVSVHARRGSLRYYTLRFEATDGEVIALDDSDQATFDKQMSSILLPRRPGRWCWTYHQGDYADVSFNISTSKWSRDSLLRSYAAHFAKWKAWYASYNYSWNTDSYIAYRALSTPMSAYYVHATLGKTNGQSNSNYRPNYGSGTTTWADVRSQLRNWQVADVATLNASFNADPGYGYATMTGKIAPGNPTTVRWCWRYPILKPLVD